MGESNRESMIRDSHPLANGWLRHADRRAGEAAGASISIGCPVMRGPRRGRLNHCGPQCGPYVLDGRLSERSGCQDRQGGMNAETPRRGEEIFRHRSSRWTQMRWGGSAEARRSLARAGCPCHRGSILQGCTTGVSPVACSEASHGRDARGTTSGGILVAWATSPCRRSTCRSRSSFHQPTSVSIRAPSVARTTHAHHGPLITSFGLRLAVVFSLVL